MEKVCEFCMALKPVIYCKADAAHLCLSCDAKIHSANALSSRHPRTLVCEACRHNPASVRCFDHTMFVCRACDRSLHKVSSQSQHQKQAIRSYMGCPSAQDFATLWGFELSQLDSTALSDRFLSISTSSSVRVEDLESPEQSSMSSQDATAFHEGKTQQNGCIIRQQILDLGRLQLTEADKISLFFIPGKQQTASLQHSLDLGTVQEMNMEPFSSPFQPLEERLAPTFGNPLQGELCWQCKSPPSSQLWSQNMQDLGICEELSCFDDFNMPDVDLTFRNFEELFGSDKDLIRACIDDKDVTCSSSADKDKYHGGLDQSHAKPIGDASVASSSVNDTHQAATNKDNNEIAGPSSQVRNCCFSSKDYSCPIRPSKSTLSLISLSRFSTDESSATDYMDSCISPVSVAGQEPHCKSPYQYSPEMETKTNAKMRCRDKKKVRRAEKQTGRGSRKGRAAVAWNHVVSGEVVKTEGYKSDEITATRSY